MAPPPPATSRPEVAGAVRESERPAPPAAAAPPVAAQMAPPMSAARAPAGAPAPLSKMTAGLADQRPVDEARAKDRKPLPVADWIALIRRLRAEGNQREAAKELAAFRATHPDHEKLLPPDLRDWRPAEK